MARLTDEESYYVLQSDDVTVARDVWDATSSLRLQACLPPDASRR